MVYILSYFLIGYLAKIILWYNSSKDSNYIDYHINRELVLLLYLMVFWPIIIVLILRETLINIYKA